MTDPSTWYYTLSTIAQTTAAILGLSAIFTVLRLEGITKNLRDCKGRALDILNAKQNRQSDYQFPNKEVKQIVKELKAIDNNFKNEHYHFKDFDLLQLSSVYEPNKNLAGQKFLQDTYTNLNLFNEQRGELIKFVKIPGLSSAVTMAISIMLLGLTDLIRHSSITQLVLLLLNIIFFILSLILIIRTSWHLLVAAE